MYSEKPRESARAHKERAAQETIAKDTGGKYEGTSSAIRYIAAQCAVVVGVGYVIPSCLPWDDRYGGKKRGGQNMCRPRSREEARRRARKGCAREVPNPGVAMVWWCSK